MRAMHAGLVWSILFTLSACQNKGTLTDDEVPDETQDTTGSGDSSDLDDSGGDPSADSDGDGVSDLDEEKNGTDPLDADSDDDGLSDGDEDTLGTDPLDADSDDDGLSDGEELDAGTDPLDADSDDDGLTDGEEDTLGTDPLDEDSDDDGLSDGEEVNTHETDPLYEDSDYDGLSDGEEVNTHETDPLSEDSDGGGASDGEEVLINDTDPDDASDDDPEDDTSLLVGHFDADTCSTISDIDSGDTDAHVHEYDDKYEITGIDYFDLNDSKLHTIDEDISDTEQAFKIVVVNADLSPGARVVLNGTYDEEDYTTWTDADDYDDTDTDDLPIYSLDGVTGTDALTSLEIHFHRLAIAQDDLHPTNTGCVKDNELGLNDEWRNGALTIQAVAVDEDGSDDFTLDDSMSSGGHGVATDGLLWEATLFWHWDGPCYHESDWSTYEP